MHKPNTISTIDENGHLMITVFVKEEADITQIVKSCEIRLIDRKGDVDYITVGASPIRI